MRVIGVIPARLASSRLPEKMLLAETGKPLLQHTWEAARQARRLDEILVATDAPEIARAAGRFGATVVLTGEHPSGTDRVAAAIRSHGRTADLILNIQGDEPELNPDHIDQLVATMAERPGLEMGTLVVPITDVRTLESPSCVKAVIAEDGRALYFSRAAVPFSRDKAAADLLAARESPWYLHIGLYAYRRDFLFRMTAAPVSRLEGIEKLEQLRALEMGASIGTVCVERSEPGIDTPADYAAFVERHFARRAA